MKEMFGCFLNLYMDDVRKAVKRLKDGKSTGVDMITSEML